MTIWQQVAITIYIVLSLIALIKGFHEVKTKKNPFGLAGYLFFLGIFVWGDAIIFGLFWTITSLIALLLKDWYLFLLTVSLFWAVRSAGEIIYWLNEQFTDRHRNPPHNLRFYSFFNSEAIWFVYQIFWQCILIISLILSIYLVSLWLNSKF